MDWKHDDLANDLASHLRGNAGRSLVWCDMQLGPAGSKRPDVFVMSTSYSRFVPLAYECKISRSDFLSDVTGGKWQEYLKFASAVIFAVPKGLIKKTEVPDRAGLIVRSDKAWRMAKRPILQVIETLPHATWMKLLMDGVRRLRVPDRPREAATWLLPKAARKVLGEEIAKAMENREHAVWRLKSETKQIELQVAHARKSGEEEKARIRSQAQEIDSLKHDFAKAIGLEPTASIWSIRDRVKAISEELTTDAEYQAILKTVTAAKTALARADETLGQKLARAGVSE